MSEKPSVMKNYELRGCSGNLLPTPDRAVTTIGILLIKSYKFSSGRAPALAHNCQLNVVNMSRPIRQEESQSAASLPTQHASQQL